MSPIRHAGNFSRRPGPVAVRIEKIVHFFSRAQTAAYTRVATLFGLTCAHYLDRHSGFDLEVYNTLGGVSSTAIAMQSV